MSKYVLLYIWTFVYVTYVTDMSLSLKRPWRLPGLHNRGLGGYGLAARLRAAARKKGQAISKNRDIAPQQKKDAEI